MRDLNNGHSRQTLRPCGWCGKGTIVFVATPQGSQKPMCGRCYVAHVHAANAR